MHTTWAPRSGALAIRPTCFSIIPALIFSIGDVTGSQSVAWISPPRTIRGMAVSPNRCSLVYSILPPAPGGSSCTGGAIMRTIVLTAVIGVFSLCGPIRADDKPAADAKALEGTWQLVGGTVGGRPFPPAVAKGITLTLSPGKYVVMAENKDEGMVKYFP